MKISLNWAQWHSNTDLTPNGVGDLVEKVGLRLGAVEAVEKTGEKYDGVIVVRLISCEKHPNADKLSVCWIDDGGTVENVERDDRGFVQVVCGAPNVREGLTVAWLPPGSTVPSTYEKEPFVLGARELRGVVSNGMLASAHELGISDDHAGILEIETEKEELKKPGKPFKQLFGVDDIVIDIENKMFTHRPDCFGALGVAREFAGIQQLDFKSPDWYLQKPDFKKAEGLYLQVSNELPELVPRFMAVAMSDVRVKPSPAWLRAGLSRVGIKSINNVVDITNYLMYLTGQPLHAYDYDKVAARTNEGAKLVIRKATKGESVKLLNGKVLQPHPDAVMIATDKELIGVGGVMGGADTEVDANTKNIILEVATFDMYSVRRTSMAHGLFTDAVTRFNKGQSPFQNDRVLAKAIELMAAQAGAKQASNVIDDRQALPETAAVVVSKEFINTRLGTGFDTEAMAALLANVEIAVEVKNDVLKVIPPFWRTDIAIAEDVVEEIGRLYGYDRLEPKLPQRTIAPSGASGELQLKSRVRQALASYGANEVLTYSFVHGNLLKKAEQNSELAFRITNALSPDLQYYRMTLTPSLLASVHQNIKSGYDAFALFEINQTHIKLHKDDDKGVPKELKMLSMVTAEKDSKSAGFYRARAYLDALADNLGLPLQYLPLPPETDYQVMKPFDPSRSALVCVGGPDQILGVIGEYRASVRKSLKLPLSTAGFEISMEELAVLIPNVSSYETLSRYPSTSQDICLQVDEKLPYGELAASFDAALHSTVQPDHKVHWEPIDIYTGDEIKDFKRITYRITLGSHTHTLTDEVLSKVLGTVGERLYAQHQAVRI